MLDHMQPASQVEPTLTRSTPEQQGVSSAAVLQFVEAVENQVHEMHSFMLLRHGTVIAEGWWSPYRREDPHQLFSVSKSFTSTAVGLAVAEGRFSLDDSVTSFFPEALIPEVSDSSHLASMQVRHLLSMTTGHAVDTWAYLVDRPDGAWMKAFFEVPVLHPPGTHFLYNTGATYMLSAIIQRTTGMKLVDYLESRLFAPLNIENARWEESPEGINLGGIGLNLKTEDLARFGQLYLQKGMWQGNRILSEAWVEQASSSFSEGSGGESDWTQGYGYQFWRCRHNAYRGDGVFGQYCVIMPDQDAVLAITGGTDIFDAQQPLDLIWELLLPAMSADPLPEHPAAHEKLTQKCSGLVIPPVPGEKSVQIASRVSGQVYQVDAGPLNLETVTLNFTDSGCNISLKTAAGQEDFFCGYGTWERGQTSLFNPDRRGVTDAAPVVAPVAVSVAVSGAWTAADRFTMVARLYETPFYHTLVYHFVGDELMIETWVNASFDAPQRLLLTARWIKAPQPG